MPPVVQKYGGTSVASAEHLRHVARRIARRVDQGDECVVVVSAMGKTTDDLVALAAEITQHPAEREYDMLLATGEIVSSALLAMALREIGHPAIALTGAQAGVYTDETFGRARITAIDTTRVQAELQLEPSRDDALFPHLYRPVQPQDVLRTWTLARTPGGWILPDPL